MGCATSTDNANAISMVKILPEGQAIVLTTSGAVPAQPSTSWHCCKSVPRVAPVISPMDVPKEKENILI